MSDDISIPTPTYRVPPRRRGMDPATRRLAFIAAGLGGAFVVLIGGWSLLGTSHQGVPVVQAELGPMRVKPTNPGGLQVAGAGNEIFSGGNDTDVGKLAPAAETPDPQALRAPPPAPVAKPAAVAPAAQSTPLLPGQVAATKPSSVSPPKPAAPTVAATAAPEPRAAAAAAPEQHAAATHDAAPSRVGAKGTLVQLAAMSSEEAAKAEWQHLNKRLPGLLSGRQPSFTKVEHSGRTYWRVRTGGFSDVNQATSFCAQVRAKGSGCALAAF